MNKQLRVLLFAAFIVFTGSSCNKYADSPETSNEGKGEKSNVDSLPVTQSLEAGNDASLGVSYDEGFDKIVYSELSQCHTQWTRGIINFFYYYQRWQNDPNTWADDVRMNKYLSLHDNGYKTAVNIRFYFKQYLGGSHIPAKNSSAFNDMLDTFWPVLLNKIMPGTDILVVGNEPFIETYAADFGTLMMDFYTKAAKRANTYKINKGVNTPLYIGAFDNVYNHLDTTDPQKPYREELLKMAHDTAWIAGADVHIHCSNLTELNNSMSTIAAGLRNVNNPMGGQKIIVTEVSLKKLFQSHNTDAVTAAFLTAYPATPDSARTVWGYINYANWHPRSLTEWNDWHRLTPFLENNKHWIRDSFNALKAYPKFLLATPSMRQGPPKSFDATTPLWILNGLFLNASVQRKPDNSCHVRYGYFDDFITINP